MEIVTLSTCYKEYSVKKRKKTQQPSTCNEQYYRFIAMNDLVTYCVHLLLQEKGQCNFEDLVAKCFTLFPAKFALRGYPQWPDSSVIQKRWLSARTDKNYISGSVKDGFRMTPAGIKVAERIHKLLNLKIPLSGRIKAEERTRSGRFLAQIERSEAWKQYQATGSAEGVSDFDFCQALMCTLDAGPRNLLKNLNLLRQCAEDYEREDILKFLSELQNGLGHLLTGHAVLKGKYRGGMTKRRLTDDREV